VFVTTAVSQLFFFVDKFDNSGPICERSTDINNIETDHYIQWLTVIHYTSLGMHHIKKLHKLLTLNYIIFAAYGAGFLSDVTCSTKSKVSTNKRKNPEIHWLKFLLVHWSFPDLYKGNLHLSYAGKIGRGLVYLFFINFNKINLLAAFCWVFECNKLFHVKNLTSVCAKSACTSYKLQHNNQEIFCAKDVHSCQKYSSSERIL